MRWLFPLLLIVSLQGQAEEANSVSGSISGSKSVAESVKAIEGATTDSTSKPEASVASGTVDTLAEKAKVDNRKESEILLNLEGNKKSSSEGSGIFRILLTLSMLGVVGTGLFIFLRKYSVPKDRKHQTQIKVLQQHYLGPKKSLAIVRVAGESILIGVTDQNITMLKSLSLLDDEVPEEAPRNFDRVMGGLGADGVSFSENETEERTKKTFAAKETSKDLDPDEEFAIKGIKDIVSKRLKGMRTF